MASEILGLFGGQNPQQLRNAFLDSTMVSPQQMAQQGLLQQVVSMGQNAGSMIGAGAGRLLGGKVAGEVEASYLEDSLAQVEKMGFKNDAEKMAALGDLLAQKPGMGRQAMLARQEANKLKEQGYKMGAMEREENYRKDLAALGANPTIAQITELDTKYGKVPEVRAAATARAALEAETKAANSRATTLTKYLPPKTPKEVITSLSSKSSLPIYQAVMKDVVNPQNEFKEVNGEIGLYNKRDGSLVHNLGKATPKPEAKSPLEKKMDLAGITDPKQRQAIAQQSLELDLKAKEGDPTALAAIELMKKQLDVQILQNKLEQTRAEQASAATAKVQGASAEAYKTNNILNTIDTAIGQVGGSTAGLGGAVMSQIPGSEAVDLQENLLTIKANIGFNELSQMRKDSPTGGALGQVSDMENKALQAARASLEQRQSPDQLRTNLNKIKDSYDRWLKVITGEWTEADAQAYLDSLKGKEKEQETSTTGAPIYATNGRQRIVSTDGGKTWQEAR